MPSIQKYKASEVLPLIRHNIREIRDGKRFENVDIDSSQSYKNYSLIQRGNTANEINKYRLDLEHTMFCYNRSNLVHAISYVYQLPDSCPKEKMNDYFQACHEQVASLVGENSIFLSVVHLDEHKFVDGIDISKPHLHVMAIPSVKTTKNGSYQYKLCADQLTRKAKLKKLAPDLNDRLEKKGIRLPKKNGSGKAVSLSVAQLKEITDKSGIVLDHSIGINELSHILDEHSNIRILDKKLEHKLYIFRSITKPYNEALVDQNKTITALHNQLHQTLKEKHTIIDQSQHMINDQYEELERANRLIDDLQKQNAILTDQTNELNQQLSDANHRLTELTERQNTISEKDLQIESLTRDLQQAQDRIASLEKDRNVTVESTWGNDPTWGNDSSWGTTSGWSDDTKTYESENIW